MSNTDTLAPSSFAVMNSVVELSKVREMLLAIDPSIEDDQPLFHDMLEGEASDSLRIIERLIEASIDAASLADAAKLRQADLAERRARFERRSAACREVALQALQTINLKRLERGHFTASIASRPPRVVITDPALIPPSLTRTTVEPMKAEITALLKTGITVAGAVLSNGGVGLNVRTK